MKKLSVLPLLLCTMILGACALQQPRIPTAQLEGQSIQGGLLRGYTQADTEVVFNGNAIEVDAQGRFVIGFAKDAPANALLLLRNDAGLTSESALEVQSREYVVQRINGLPPSKVSPPEEELPRIFAEARALREARSVNTGQSGIWQQFKWPLVGPITGVYGSGRVYNGVPRRPHYGIDIAAPTGTPIIAPATGVVTLAHKDMFFTGGTLVLDHGHGIFSTMVHLSKILAAEGQQVQQGEVIGEVGATGRATGPHLHWQVNWFQLPVDPALLVPPMEPKP